MEISKHGCDCHLPSAPQTWQRQMLCPHEIAALANILKKGLLNETHSVRNYCPFGFAELEISQINRRFGALHHRRGPGATAIHALNFT
jgi:hypothetical protein